MIAWLTANNQLQQCGSFTLFATTNIVSGAPFASDTVRFGSSSTTTSTSSSTGRKPIVYTIAGSDSGGGAGIQADLLAIHNFHCHGCSAITCLTAQNSVNVTAVHTPPVSFLQQQWHTLLSDLPPLAIKIGMLGSKEMMMTVGSLLKELQETNAKQDIAQKVWIVLDPVMISTSGSRLIDHDAQQALIDHVFPYVDVITPNLFEAQALLNGHSTSRSDEPAMSIQSYDDMEIVAAKLLNLGCNAVLLKGGHFPSSSPSDQQERNDNLARDFLLVASSSDCSSLSSTNERRLCDADVSGLLDSSDGVWLQSCRYDSEHTHGTGCTLSAALASALALGEDSRRHCHGVSLGSDAQKTNHCGGAYAALNLVDACCLAKAYVTAGISQSQPLMGAKGPGPVGQTSFPRSYKYYPTIQKTESSSTAVTALKPTFWQFGTRGDHKNDQDNMLGVVLPIVDSVEWVERLCEVKRRRLAVIDDIQIRIKGEIDPDNIASMIADAQNLCTKANIRLWVNDHWEAAVSAQCFGVHLGQEDLYRCSKAGGIDILREKNMALGISSHTFGELAVALGLSPSYISLGPIFATGSKNVQIEPQGLDVLHQWRQLIPPNVPLVAIGGINDVERASRVCHAGADCIAVIGAVTGSCDIDEIAAAISRLDSVMAR
jgi:hydroxymethylpyrimidine kinase / phosphomethylpyrimidine kinase / thiamine-phosphate diphosphorylase